MKIHNICNLTVSCCFFIKSCGLTNCHHLSCQHSCLILFERSEIARKSHILFSVRSWTTAMILFYRVKLDHCHIIYKKKEARIVAMVDFKTAYKFELHIIYSVMMRQNQKTNKTTYNQIL